MVRNSFFSVTPEVYGDEWVRGFEAATQGLDWEPPRSPTVARSWRSLLIEALEKEPRTRGPLTVTQQLAELGGAEAGLVVELLSPLEDAYLDGWERAQGVNPLSVTNADKARFGQGQALGWKQTPSLRFLLGAVHWPEPPAPGTPVSMVTRLGASSPAGSALAESPRLSQPAEHVAADYRSTLGYMLSADGLRSTGPSVCPKPTHEPLPDDVDERRAPLQDRQSTLRFAVAEMLPPACQRVTLTLTLAVRFGRLSQALDFSLT